MNVRFERTKRQDIVPEGYYWSWQREGAPGIWCVQERVGPLEINGQQILSEPDYAARLDATTPRCTSHKCKRGAELLAMVEAL